MTLTFVCDNCKKEFDNEHLIEGYDGVQLCTKCALIEDIASLNKEIKDKLEWVKEVHINPLKQSRESLREMKEKLKELNKEKS